MIYPRLSDGTIDWCVMCKHEGNDFYDLCCECEYPENSDDPPAKYEPKPVTNGDRIRRMADDELAALLGKSDAQCPPLECPIPNEVCNPRVCWLAWLKQEASDE